MSPSPDLSALKIDRPKGGYDRAGGSSPWLWRGLFLALLGFLAWRFQPQLSGLLERPPAEVTLRVVSRRRAASGGAQGMAANGHLVAARRAALSADTPGRIVELSVQEGDRVAAGQVVARLYSDEYAAAVDRAHADARAADAEVERLLVEVEAAQSDLARLTAARSAAEAAVRAEQAAKTLAVTELARAKKLASLRAADQRQLDQAVSTLAASEARLDQRRAEVSAAKADLARAEIQIELVSARLPGARAQVDQAKAAAAQAEATLAKTEVRAPFAGVVVLKDAEVGEVVSPNVTGGASSRGAIVTMIDPASLEVQAEVPETNLAGVRLGDAVRVYLDADPSRPRAGVVARVWPTANRQKATIEVHARLTEVDESLRPDMGVRVVFLAEGVDAAATAASAPEKDLPLTVPEQALAVRDGVRGVFVYTPPTVRFRKVQLGETEGGSVDVLGGLEAGDRVVVGPARTLIDGARAKVKE